MRRFALGAEQRFVGDGFNAEVGFVPRQNYLQMDQRADLCSFGVLIFELLTGRQLFAGDTVRATLAAALRRAPDSAAAAQAALSNGWQY